MYSHYTPFYNDYYARHYLNDYDYFYNHRHRHYGYGHRRHHHCYDPYRDYCYRSRYYY